MKPKLHPSVVCIFCDDVRQEQSGATTILGVMSDNVNVPGVPGLLPKLGLYVRARFATSKPPPSFSVKLKVPWQTEVANVGKIEPGAIATEVKAARQRGNDAMGFVLAVVTAPFPVPQVGRIEAIATVGKEEWNIGSLNFIVAGHPNKPETKPTPSRTVRRRKRAARSK